MKGPSFMLRSYLLCITYDGSDFCGYQIQDNGRTVGGVMLAAVFMATDYVTTPTTKLGQIIFGIGCGVITSIIRFWGGYPEGATYAILLMNVITPLLDKWTVPKPFGFVKPEKAKEGK